MAKKKFRMVHNGTYGIFVFIKSMGGRHHVSIREHRISIHWADESRYLIDGMYSDVEKIILVMDNLNTIHL